MTILLKPLVPAPSLPRNLNPSFPSKHDPSFPRRRESRRKPLSFPRYPASKDSGAQWLGVVPGHWRRSGSTRPRPARQPGAFAAGCGPISRAEARVASADRPMQAQITGP